jgi:hypothetical protein
MKGSVNKMECKDCIIGYYSYFYGDYHGLCKISNFKEILEDCKRANGGKIDWYYKKFKFCPICGKEIQREDIKKCLI